MASHPRDTRSTAAVLARPVVTTRASRAEADKQAVASLWLEGLTPDAQSDADTALWVEGRLTSEEVIDRIYQRYGL
jgi:hypothetical protein